MKREQLLDKAKEIVMGARQEHYGAPEDNFKNIARLWTAFLENERDARGDDTTIYPHTVALMMNLMKIARLQSDPTHEDSWLDIPGYAACGSEIMNKGD